MTPDELKTMKKGQFVVMKTGFYPIKVKLKLFFRWGITIEEENPYIVAENGNRAVEYADRTEIMNGIIKKYHPDMKRIKDGELEDVFIGIPEDVDICALTGEDEPTIKRSDTRGRKGLRTISKHRRD